MQKDEPVVVIDSEKTTFELPAPESGTLGRILHQAGATVAVGEVIAHLETGGGATEKPAASPSPKVVERSKAGAKKTPSPAVAKEEQDASSETKDDMAESAKTRVTTQPVRQESDHAEAAVPEQPEVTPESEATPAEAEVAEPAEEEPESESTGNPSPPVARKASSRAPDGGRKLCP